MMIAIVTEDITLVSCEVDPLAKAPAGGVASIEKHVKVTGVDHHRKDV